MKILILGAGRVGSSIAENLLRESTEITVVDSDPDRLQDLAERFDLRTVHGHGSHPSVLAQAGAASAEMLIAVTASDETNMAACRIAASLFGTPNRIARIRATDYMNHPEIFGDDCLGVEYFLSPEQVVSEYVCRLVEHPGALQILDFADGKIELVALRTPTSGGFGGCEISAISDRGGSHETRVVALYRHGSSVWPDGDVIVQPGDEVFLLAAPGDVRRLLRQLGGAEQHVRHVFIGGGGRIGTRLAQMLEGNYNVKIIEQNKPASERLSRELTRALVLNGDVTDSSLLERNGIADSDVYCAVTSSDEYNIMSCRLAKRMGVPRVICLINRPAYVDLLEGSEIDIAISPAQATLGLLLAHVRRADIPVVHSLRRGTAEAMEIVVHGEAVDSPVAGRRIDDLPLPDGVHIGGIARGSDVIMAHRDTVIENGDHVIAFVEHKRAVSAVERLFRVS